MKLGTQNWPSPSRELGLGGWDAPTHTHTCYLDEREGGTVIYVLTTNPLLLIRRYCSDRMLSGWAAFCLCSIRSSKTSRSHTGVATMTRLTSYRIQSMMSL